MASAPSSSLKVTFRLVDSGGDGKKDGKQKANFREIEVLDGKQGLYEDILYAALPTIHESVSALDQLEIFKVPVTDDVAPMYSQIIKHPMDLSTMKSKIQKRKYKSLRDYQDDLVLMCENCMTYNQDDTIFFKEAQKLKDKGLKMLKKEMVKLEKELAKRHKVAKSSSSPSPKRRKTSGSSPNLIDGVALTQLLARCERSSLKTRRHLDKAGLRALSTFDFSPEGTVFLKPVPGSTAHDQAKVPATHLFAGPSKFPDKSLADASIVPTSNQTYGNSLEVRPKIECPFDSDPALAQRKDNEVKEYLDSSQTFMQSLEEMGCDASVLDIARRRIRHVSCRANKGNKEKTFDEPPPTAEAIQRELQSYARACYQDRLNATTPSLIALNHSLQDRLSRPSRVPPTQEEQDLAKTIISNLQVLAQLNSQFKGGAPSSTAPAPPQVSKPPVKSLSAPTSVSTNPTTTSKSGQAKTPPNKPPHPKPVAPSSTSTRPVNTNGHPGATWKSPIVQSWASSTTQATTKSSASGPATTTSATALQQQQQQQQPSSQPPK